MRNLRHRARRKRRCSTTGKFSYLRHEDALADMRLVHEKNKGIGPPLCVYRCHDCREFHVGHTPVAIRVKFGL